MEIREFIAKLKPSYDSGFGDNLGKEFYSPCLENCKEYRRMTGEFRSSDSMDKNDAGPVDNVEKLRGDKIQTQPKKVIY